MEHRLKKQYIHSFLKLKIRQLEHPFPHSSGRGEIQHQLLLVGLLPSPPLDCIRSLVPGKCGRLWAVVPCSSIVACSLLLPCAGVWCYDLLLSAQDCLLEGFQLSWPCSPLQTLSLPMTTGLASGILLTDQGYCA